MLAQAVSYTRRQFPSARHLFGWALLIAGVIGLFLPVLPGLPLVLAGAAVLGPEHPVVQTWKARIARWRNRGTRAEKSPQFSQLIGDGGNGTP